MTQPTTSPSWHVAFTNPNCEFRAEMGLTSRGFQVFLPTFTKLVRGARQEKILERPLFPRYLFLVIPTTRFEDVRRTDGVEKLVFDAGSLATLSDDTVQKWQKLDSCGLLDDARLVPPELKAGDRFKVRYGPLAGYIVRLIDAPRRERVKVLLELLDSNRPVDIAIANLRKEEYLGAAE